MRTIRTGGRKRNGLPTTMTMRSKPINHRKHESMAITAFIITLAISIIAFYYVYQQNTSYGKTILGLQSYVASSYCREQKLSQAECAVALANAQIVQVVRRECCGLKKTPQDDGSLLVTSFSVGISGTIIGRYNWLESEKYGEDFKPCAGNEECACEVYMTRVEKNTEYLDVTDKNCPIIHKKEYPKGTA